MKIVYMKKMIDFRWNSKGFPRLYLRMWRRAIMYWPNEPWWNRFEYVVREDEAAGIVTRLYRWITNQDEIDRLKDELARSDRERQFRESEAVDMTNLWWMACECVGLDGDVSGGRFRDEIKKLKQSAEGKADE